VSRYWCQPLTPPPVPSPQAVTGRFKGDPSFPLEGSPDEEPPADEEGAAPKTERFREVHRLIYTVEVRGTSLPYSVSDQSLVSVRSMTMRRAPRPRPRGSGRSTDSSTPSRCVCRIQRLLSVWVVRGGFSV
jgi:hypothetical protein